MSRLFRSSPLIRYLLAILDTFIKWWWAAITGVASILSWFAVPSDGVTFQRWGVSLLIFVACLLVFLVGSILTKSYRWYTGSVEQPRVIEFIPRVLGGDANEPVCTFVIQEAGWKLTHGHIFALYSTERNAEACVAIVRVERQRHSDDGLQCIPIWISPGYLNDLSQDAQRARDLIIRREIPENRLGVLNKP